MVSDVADVIE